LPEILCSLGFEGGTVLTTAFTICGCGWSSFFLK
jgi:hypothetical protein